MSASTRAAEDTLTVYPDWHGPPSTWTLLAGTGHAWRLHPALLRSLRVLNLDERFPAGRGGGRCLEGAMAAFRPGRFRLAGGRLRCTGHADRVAALAVG
jgi:hypothetical protein